MGAHRYLLDTNILSHLVKEPAGIVAHRIEAVGEEAICTSIIIASELRFGAEKKGSPRLSTQLEKVLSALEILPLEEPADRHYAIIRTHLQRIGQPIGYNDMFIAAHALALSLTLVTHNQAEFARVPGLTVENWLVP
jgi:tRNA(fMet)-specific endonuclease VapC